MCGVDREQLEEFMGGSKRRKYLVRGAGEKTDGPG